MSAPEPVESNSAAENAGPDAPGTDASATPADVSTPPKPKRGMLRKALAMVASVVLLLVVLGAFGSKVVAQPYNVPSESMAPTLMRASASSSINSLIGRAAWVCRSPATWSCSRPRQGGTSATSRSDRPTLAVRWLQNALSFVGFVPADENHLVSRIIAVGGQTVQCRVNTGITVDGEPVTEPYLELKTLSVDPSSLPVSRSRVRPREGAMGTAVGDGRQSHTRGGFPRTLHQPSR